MRQAIFLLAAFVVAAHSTHAQTSRSPLARLEQEMLARIIDRAMTAGGFQLGTGEFDIRLPTTGEPEEILGPTLHSSDALAVGSARLEPLDSIAERDAIFRNARYDFRIEDRAGNCLIIHHVVAMDSTTVQHRRRTSEKCQPLYMAEVVRRARRIARLSFSAGNLTDHWSASLAATGNADVYADSIVITTTSIAVRASYPSPATAAVRIDSISAGLGAGDKSWSTIKQSAAIRVDTTLHQNGEWRRQTRRFMIPIDSTVELGKSWPLFQVHVRAPVTADNPSGLAWTYAHERKGFFSKLSER